MVQKLEKSVEQRVVRWARKHKILTLKLNVIGQRGWPDRVFWVRGGRPVIIEFKRKGKDTRKRQKYIIGQLRDRNYDVYVCDDYEDAIGLLEETFV